MLWHAITSAFIHCVSPPRAQPCGVSSQTLNPFRETECQTAVVQEEVSLPRHQRFYPRGLSQFGSWYLEIRKHAAVTREKNPKAISWFNFPPTGFISQWTVANKVLKTNSFTVSRIQPASVLLSIGLSLQALPLLLLMELSFQSGKLRRQSTIRTTSSWFLGRGLDLSTITDKEDRPRLDTESNHATSAARFKLTLAHSVTPYGSAAIRRYWITSPLGVPQPAHLYLYKVSVSGLHKHRHVVWQVPDNLSKYRFFRALSRKIWE